VQKDDSATDVLKHLMWLASHVIWKVGSELDSSEMLGLIGYGVWSLSESSLFLFFFDFSLMVNIFSARPSLLKTNFDQSAGLLLASVCNRSPSLFTTHMARFTTFAQFLNAQENDSRYFDLMCAALPEMRLLEKMVDSFSCAKMFLERGLLFALAKCVANVCHIAIDSVFGGMHIKFTYMLIR